MMASGCYVCCMILGKCILDVQTHMYISMPVCLQVGDAPKIGLLNDDQGHNIEG